MYRFFEVSEAPGDGGVVNVISNGDSKAGYERVVCQRGCRDGAIVVFG